MSELSPTLLPNPELAKKEDPIKNALLLRIAKIQNNECANGHHPEPWLEKVLSGKEAADDSFNERYLEEYRWVAALIADACGGKERPETLMCAAEDALFDAALDYSKITQGKRPANFVEYASQHIRDYLAEVFEISDLQNPYDDQAVREALTPLVIEPSIDPPRGGSEAAQTKSDAAKTEESIDPESIENTIPLAAMPGNRQPEDMPVGTRVFYQVIINSSGGTAITTGKVESVKRYEHRSKDKEYVPHPRENPSPGFVRITLKQPNLRYPHAVIADVNNCLIVPSVYAHLLVSDRILAKQWFSEGYPQSPPRHDSKEDFLNDLRQYIATHGL